MPLDVLPAAFGLSPDRFYTGGEPQLVLHSNSSKTKPQMQFSSPREELGKVMCYSMAAKISPTANPTYRGAVPLQRRKGKNHKNAEKMILGAAPEDGPKMVKKCFRADSPTRPDRCSKNVEKMV